MANPAQRGPASDDDSWGKIATDLFGIQFNEDDDFELPDDQAPVAKTPPVSPVIAPAISKAPEETVHHKHADVIEEVVAEEATPDKKGKVPGNEDHDEFWDILESWNWDESAKGSAAPKKTDDSRSRRPRQEPAAPEPRRSQRDESPRREETHQRREEPVRREEPAARREEPPRREESPPRDEKRREEKRRESPDRPRRRDAEPVQETTTSDEEARKSRSQREETRRERPARAEQPPRTRRPEADRPVAERPPAERRPERSSDRPRTREVPSAFVGDEFGSGVDETVESPRSRHPQPVRKREEPPAPPKRKPVAARRPKPVDDFEGDLFVEDFEEEAIDDESDDFVEQSVTDADSDDNENAPPRRRRRRRRRGRGRSTADSTSITSDQDIEESTDAEETGSFDETDEESAEVEATEDDQDEEREVRRPRRRRRRRTRRTEAAPVSESDSDDYEESSNDEDGDEEQDEMLAEDVDVESDDPDEEVVVPVSYEGIPTWEEAISYLVIVPPNESRGHRGRSDGSRRDDSRRR